MEVKEEWAPYPIWEGACTLRREGGGQSSEACSVHRSQVCVQGEQHKPALCSSRRGGASSLQAPCPWPWVPQPHLPRPATGSFRASDKITPCLRSQGKGLLHKEAGGNFGGDNGLKSLFEIVLL